MNNLLNQQLPGRTAELNQAFNTAKPFRHLVIDDFFDAEFCQTLVKDFPSFDEKRAMNENGEVGGKATQEQVTKISPAYKKLDEMVKSDAFLKLVSEITGIPELRYDPYYFGGGTHENRHGQDLDAHVDFNFHPITKQHRRLNLIVYFNDEWQDDWGGSLDLHKDPYVPPEHDEIVTVTPLMNRCVIFETTEWSWHGFTRINLPEEHANLSRKSFALYYYTDVRPKEELAKAHSTIYVERHLPPHIEPGKVLADEDYQHIRMLLNRRDQHLKRLYGNVQNLQHQLDSAVAQSAAIQMPQPESSDSDATEPQEAEALEQMVTQLQNQLYQIRNSTSWRITAPLRKLRYRVGRMIKG